MKITSTAFADNQMIPIKYTCDGKDINPPLEISGVPENAKCLALIMDDPDAPSPPVGGWVHWVVFNILPEIKEISENSLPGGAREGINDFGRNSYGGPCPHIGTHRYFFKIYALDAILDLGSSSRKEDVEKAMEEHILDSGQLVGLYKRQ